MVGLRGKTNCDASVTCTSRYPREPSGVEAPYFPAKIQNRVSKKTQNRVFANCWCFTWMYVPLEYEYWNFCVFRRET